MDVCDATPCKGVTDAATFEIQNLEITRQYMAGTDETVDNETGNRGKHNDRGDQTLGKLESIREGEGHCQCRSQYIVEPQAR